MPSIVFLAYEHLTRVLSAYGGIVCATKEEGSLTDEGVTCLPPTPPAPPAPSAASALHEMSVGDTPHGTPSSSAARKTYYKKFPDEGL